MKFLSIAGTVAMFLVGGGILVHGIPFIHHYLENLVISNSILKMITTSLAEGGVGIFLGFISLLCVKFVSAVSRKIKLVRAYKS